MIELAVVVAVVIITTTTTKSFIEGWYGLSILIMLSKSHFILTNNSRILATTTL